MPAKTATSKSKKVTRAYSRPSYARPYRSVGGKGAYYVRGSLGASAKLPYVGKASAKFAGGYTSGSTAMARLKGLGSYSLDRIRRNVLIRPDPPSVYNKIVDDGMSTVIRHREFVQNITSSSVAGQFNIETFPVNPAMPNLFPWLSTIAQNFEEYQFEGVCLEFQSTSSDAIASSTNLALGSVMMASQYDPANPDFTNAQSLLNYDWAQSGKVSNNVYHYLECDPRQNVMSKFYTRQGAEPNDDLRMCDIAKFSIATEGLQGTSVLIGRLWVSYQVRLFKPKISASEAEGGSLFHFSNGSNVVVATPLGTIADGFIRPDSNMYVILSNVGTDGVIQLPQSVQAKTYSVVISYVGTNTAAVLAPSIYNMTAGIHSLDMLNNNSYNMIICPAYAGNSTMSSVNKYITVDSNTPSPTLKFNLSVIPASAYLDVIITELPYIDPSLYP